MYRKLVIRTRNGKSHGYWITSHYIKKGDYYMNRAGDKLYEYGDVSEKSYDDYLNHIEKVGKIIIRDNKIKKILK